MKAKTFRMVLAVAASTAALALAGCGNNSVSATTESAAVSTAEITAAVESTVEDTTTEEEDVIAPQEIQPDAVTITAAPEEADSLAESTITTDDTDTTDSATETTEGTDSESTESEATDSSDESVAYTIAGVNFRESGSSDADVIDAIEPGEEITVIGGMDSGWTRIRYDGVEGYIATRFITTDADEAAEAKEDYYDDDDDYSYSSSRSYDYDDDDYDDYD